MPDIPLGRAVRIKHGHAFPGSDFVEDGRYPTLVTPGNFAIGGGFKAATRPKTFAGEIPSEFVLTPGSLVITMTDLSKTGDILGLPAIIPGDGTYLHNQRIGLVQVLDPTLVDLRFLSYYLRTDAYRSHVLGTATGSTVRHTSPSRIERFIAALPSVSEQAAVAAVLGALDDKIAANDRLVANAGELAREWFRSEATDPVSLSLLARFVNGKAFTKDASNTGRVVIRIAELNSGLGGSTVRNDIDVADDHLAKPGDLLFAWSGSLTAARWFHPEAIVNQHIFKVIPHMGFPVWLVHEAVQAKLDDFRAIAADKATTMGHIQRHHLDQPVLVPNGASTRRLDALMTGLWDRALAAEQESLLLAATRDELLPLLMSGKIRVRDAQKVVEET